MKATKKKPHWLLLAVPVSRCTIKGEPERCRKNCNYATNQSFYNLSNTQTKVWSDQIKQSSMVAAKKTNRAAKGLDIFDGKFTGAEHRKSFAINTLVNVYARLMK